MSDSDPHLGDYGEPPDGDYARYVERLLQDRGPQRAAVPAGAHAKAGAAVAAATSIAKTTGTKASRPRQANPAGPAAARAMLARWPLLLWILFALLMWFAPALLPLAIGAVVVAGVGYGVWKSRRGPGANDR